MRKKIIAGNWKMNKNIADTKDFLESIKDKLNNDNADVVFCVPYTDISKAVCLLKGTNIAVGAQNMHFEDSGAYTGEISGKMLKELEVSYVIIGHSERRQYFNETDETVNKKVKKAFECGLIPIICVGESLEQRDQDVTIELVRLQTKIALKDVPAELAKTAVIAYEPIWAIGTGRTATSEQAQEVCKAIRQVVSDICGNDVAEVIRIQYGGSVSEKNASELFGMPDIDGGLVGGASLKADFEKIVNY